MDSILRFVSMWSDTSPETCTLLVLALPSASSRQGGRQTLAAWPAMDYVKLLHLTTVPKLADNIRKPNFCKTEGVQH